MPGPPIVAVFGASRPRPGEPRYAEAERCGRLLGEAGFAVLTGGYGGTMEAASRGARRSGAHVVGVTAPLAFPNRPGANPFVVEEIPAPTIARRIDIMLEMASAAITLPGSIGTLTELMVAWNIAYVASTSSHPTRPVVAVGDPWRELVPRLTDLLATDGSLVTLVDSVEEAVVEVAGGVAR